MSAQDSTEGIVIAIDGPSGSGKSSTSRGVARVRNLRYLDTGAMYRAITWWMLSNDVNVNDAEAVASLVERPVIVMGTDPNAPTVTVDGRDVAAEIRERDVTTNVSAVSAVPETRERMVRSQREIIAKARAESAGIVVEGRDITTVVAPDATVKLFLTASAEARAQRRSKEVRTSDVAATQADLARRDELDSNRAHSPLRQTADATELDTTGLTLDEVVALVSKLADEARDR
ncbi:MULTISPECIES: (d)CMP kinase [Nocardiopsis]|uniref:Cytidylate kinase n=1 Tax=Nocardiopsis sinuspersici TaxID=501010 RepID=A0A1V3BXY0_9ACTN|nr:MULTISPECIES: (d)CMP kinase [Nocardiopsis]NYH54444.1 cytidylate kinase [Nocardiopsis sinuspersici]OOC53232.1 cytidylate kinase [Nocardiopsis sinuspersici]